MLCGVPKQYLISGNILQVLSQLCSKKYLIWVEGRKMRKRQSCSPSLTWLQKTDKSVEGANNISFIACAKVFVRPQGPCCQFAHPEIDVGKQWRSGEKRSLAGLMNEYFTCKNVHQLTSPPSLLTQQLISRRHCEQQNASTKSLEHPES